MKSENEQSSSSLIELKRNSNKTCDSSESDKNSESIKLDSRLTTSPKLFPITKIDINDFDILSNLGEGAYAKVVLAKQKKTGRIYAIKMIDRKHIQKVINKIGNERISGYSRKRCSCKVDSSKYY